MLDSSHGVAAAAIMPGTRLNGIFEIDQRLAAGGMGEIYSGHAVETGDPVAIKVLRTDLADDEAALALFRNEAKALYSIHHEAIVRYFVFSSDPTIRRHYLAMEFVDGEPLSDVLDRGPLRFEEVQALQQRLAAALHEAHCRGVIHRDMSPDNVIIQNGDVALAKIIDFGIARVAKSTTIIGSGFAGKYNYVSPEQLGLFEGNVTAKSDIYSLGIVLAECALGRSIDMGGSHVDMIEKRRVVPDLAAVDPRLRPLLLDMLQPDPRDRPESMAAVAAWRPSQSLAREARGPPASRDHVEARETGGARPKWKSVAGMLAVIAVAVLPGGPTSELPPASLIERIMHFVNAFDGGDCFFAAPVAVSEREAILDGYSSDGSLAPFKALDSQFHRDFGFGAFIGVHQVTQAQCAAVDFLHRAGKQQAITPRLEIDDAKLAEGVLSGSVAGSGAGHVDLILIADDGTVYNLTSRLAAMHDKKTFDVNLPRARGGPQLLLTVVSSTSLAALESTGIADQIFARAFGEAGGRPLAVSAKYFKLQR